MIDTIAEELILDGQNEDLKHHLFWHCTPGRMCFWRSRIDNRRQIIEDEIMSDVWKLI